MTLNSDQQPDYSVTSFDTVVVQKDALLATLKTNRDTHQAIYDAACVGYWQEASKVLVVKEGEFNEAVSIIGKQFTEQKEKIGTAIEAKDRNKIPAYFSVGLKFGTTWPLTYPVNHLEDYDRVINMMEFSVADKVRLSATDFDAYVRNNWKWKDEFVTSNQAYVSCVTGSMFAGLTASGPNFEPDSPVYRFAARGETV